MPRGSSSDRRAARRGQELGHELGAAGSRRAVAKLPLWQRLAPAVLALVFYAGVALPAWGSTRLVAAAFDTAARTTASAKRDARQPDARQPDTLQRWHDATRAEVALNAVESGDDDRGGGDARCEVTHGTVRSLRCVPLQEKPDRVLRGALPLDPSRFAAGACLPRGPPASRT